MTVRYMTLHSEISSILKDFRKVYPLLSGLYNKEASWIGSVYAELFVYNQLHSANLIAIIGKERKQQKITRSSDIIVVRNTKNVNIEVKFSACHDKENYDEKLYKNDPKFKRHWGWSFSKKQLEKSHYFVLFACEKDSLIPNRIFVLENFDLKDITLRKGISKGRYIRYSDSHPKDFLKALKRRFKTIFEIEKKINYKPKKYDDPNLKELIKKLKIEE
jgi:hypothetical protein